MRNYVSYDERITTYFGDAVMRAGFLPIPHLLMRHYAALDLNADQAMFAMQLMAINWDIAHPPDTMKKLAQRMGVSLRTAQRYSEQLCERGLLIIYEQFQAGAQIENGYDLSPLFRRLAAFAPEPRPSGEPRERRVRSGNQPVQVTSETRDVDTTAEARSAIAIVGAHATSDILPGVTDVTPSGVRNDIPPRVIADTPHMTSAPGLNRKPKKNSKNKLLRNRQQQNGAAVVNIDDKEIAKVNTPIADRAGFSIRSEIPFTSLEVSQSRKVLAQIGINANVADAVAPVLHPAECWSLWLYARTNHLGAGWIAKEIYDLPRRRARIPGIPHAYDIPGRLLAKLPLATATALIDLAMHPTHPPGDLPALLGESADITFAEETFATIRSTLVAPRSPREHSLSQIPSVPRLPAQPDKPCWLAIRQRLQDAIPHEQFETWIAPLCMVVLEDDFVVLAAPNVFVRNEVNEHYIAEITASLTSELGRLVRVELVIDQ